MNTPRATVTVRILRRVLRNALVIALTAVSGFAGAQQPIVVQALECGGEEPGWHLEANRTSAQHTMMGTKGKREVVYFGSLQSLAFLTPPAIVWRGDSTRLPRETLVVVLREEVCRSTMADGPPLTHRAVLSVKAGEAVAGCCTVRAGFDARVAPVAQYAVKKDDDWARLLPDLAPAISACVLREGARARVVTKAWPLPQGKAGVRILGTTGASVDCIVEANGRGSPAMSAVDASAAPLPGAGNPQFYLAREQPPIVNCGRLERAQSSRGTLIGYLHYDPC